MVLLEKHLKKFIATDGNPVNYTKIGSTEHNIFGNKYSIPSDKISEFYDAYKNHVFVNHNPAYITEKQLTNGKIAIDIDFRYKNDVNKKQHTKEHIVDLIELIMTGLINIFTNLKKHSIQFYIFEKEKVNICKDKTKDGIHIIINIITDFATKMILRNYIIQNIVDIWDDLPITNTWNDVVDESVMKGHANWQLYGSKKPGNEPYKLKYIYNNEIHDNEIITVNEIDISTIHFDTYFPYFCVRDITNTTEGILSNKYKDEYARINNDFIYKKNKSLKVKKKSNCNSLYEIKSNEDIDAMICEMIDDKSIDYTIKEIHNYTMMLSKEYWGPGSYDKWIRVGWALKNHSERLVLTWYKFCSQSEDFDFVCNDVLEHWSNFGIYNKEGLTYKSIMYWCRMSNLDEYNKIYKNTVEYYIHYSFQKNNDTEVDLANTLFHMYKSQYVCVSIKEDTWYEFQNNKWYPIDCGTTLRSKISREMYNLYSKKVIEFQTKNNVIQNNMITPSSQENTIVSNQSDESFSDYKKKMESMFTTCKLLKKTATKNNIMRECKELFYDKEFLNKLDKNEYLLGCSNCIIDFKNKEHRKGKHDDYVSKSTNLNYFPLSQYQKNNQKDIDEINEFMCQLFPNKDLLGYMWEHLASTLLGTNENQTFNIYTGSGANGKSKLVELMSIILGEYKGTVPITLVTQKRNNIGGTSSEVYNLIGKRYAVMQEPSKGDKINEGIMKELTGGDPIQCRALFQNSMTFIPQFKLVVCTNTLFDIISNDDGTWRRLRKVDFESKFTSKPYNDPQFPREDYPHQFKVDTKIDEKFRIWAPIMLSILVDIAYKTQGNVKDVEPVMAATEMYRQDQDILLEFYKAAINPVPRSDGYGIHIRDLKNKYNEYIRNISGNIPNRMMPNTKELQKFIEKKHGKYNSKCGWTNISYLDDADIDGDFH